MRTRGVGTRDCRGGRIQSGHEPQVHEYILPFQCCEEARCLSPLKAAALPLAGIRSKPHNRDAVVEHGGQGNSNSHGARPFY